MIRDWAVGLRSRTPRLGISLYPNGYNWQAHGSAIILPGKGRAGSRGRQSLLVRRGLDQIRL